MGDRAYVTLVVPTSRADEVAALLEEDFSFEDRQDLENGATSFGIQDINGGCYGLLEYGLGDELTNQGIAFDASDDGYPGVWGPNLIYWRPGMELADTRVTDGDGSVVLTKHDLDRIEEPVRTADSIVAAIHQFFDGPRPVQDFNR